MKYLAVLLAGMLVLSLCCCVKKTELGVLCTGNGSTSYRPLAKGNCWHYETDSVNNANYDTIVGQSGSTYYICNFLPSHIVYSDTFRIDGNGDIYILNATFTSEHLLTPANPVLGQTWNYKDTAGQVYYETVLSTSATVGTPECLYTNCLEIQDSLIDNLVNVVYYARGIGVVQSNIVNNGQIVSVSQLSGLNLH